MNLSELSGGHIVKSADIECVDTNGSTAQVRATCNIAEDDSHNQDVMLRMKNAQGVHIGISCYTRRE